MFDHQVPRWKWKINHHEEGKVTADEQERGIDEQEGRIADHKK